MDNEPELPARVARDELFARLPPDWPEDPLPATRASVRARGETVVVLDDDPTGTQSVHGVPVLTRWPDAVLRAELAAAPAALYLLTNSRSLPPDDAAALNREAGAALAAAARAVGRPIAVISRGDSTLRGHFPDEVDALAAGLGGRLDATLLIPAFIAGGRFTIGDVHYLAEGDALVPVAETPFARDAAFGYRASNLRAWVQEKTGGRIPAAAVASVPIETVRRGPDAVAGALADLPRGAVCAVNAASERDLAVIAQGALQVEAGGRRFLYRTAASFVPARAGMENRPLLDRAGMDLPPAGGGLIVVGSHVPATTAQVALMRASGEVAYVEASVEALLSGGGEIGRVVAATAAALARGRDVAIATSRALVLGEGAAGSLAIGAQVSAALVAIVRQIGTRPRYLLAKGGITSSNLATGGLGVRRALVLGQIAPGVPVWELGPESRFPGLRYIVFPGNVGGPGALAAMVRGLAADRE